MTDRSLPDGSRDVRRWPGDPLQLVDTSRCPACFSPLAGPQCRVCGLDLDVPAASELLSLSKRLYDLEVARQSFISHMRAAQAARVDAAHRTATPVAVPATGGSPVASEAHATGTTARRTEQPAARSAAPPPRPPVPGAAPPPSVPARPGRSGVQVLLLTLGVVLISVTAVVFLFVAYLVAGLEVRSVIIAAASVLVLGAAWLLRARRLPGTAEGVASVAIVLLLLDVWIVRANDLFGTGAVSASTYTGIALLLVAGLLTATRIASGIRVTGFGAAALVPVASFLLASSLVPESNLFTGIWAGGLAAATVGALASLAARPPAVERVILLWGAAIGGVLALASAAWAVPDPAWNELWSFLAVAIAWLLILGGLRLADTAPAFSIVAACAVGASVALAPAVGVLDETQAGVALWAAPALAGVAACVIAAVTRAAAAAGMHPRAAFFAAAAVALAAALPAGMVGLAGIGRRLLSSVPPFAGGDPDGGLTSGGLGEAPFADLDAGAVLAPLVIAIGSTAALWLLGSLRPFAAIPIGAAAAGMVAAGGVADDPGTAVVLLVVLAAVALLLAAWGGMRDIPALLPTLGVFGIGAAALAWWTGFSTVWVWPWAMLASLILVIGGRVAASRIWRAGALTAAAAVHTTITALLATVVLGSIAPWLAAAESELAGPWNAPSMWVGTGAPLLLAAALIVPRLNAIDRTGAALPLIVASFLASIAAASDVDPAVGWLPAALAAAVGLIGLRWSRQSVVPLLLAATTPVLLGFALTTGFVGADVADELIAPAIAALLAAALGHLVLDGRSAASKAVWTVSVLATGAVALTIGWPIDALWLSLLILTPVPLLLAALGGDPLRGTHASRHLAWASLPLGVGAVWTWLAGEGIEGVEAYTLPLAAAIAASGALIAWRRPVGTAPASGRTALIATAAAVAVLPSVASSGDSEPRTLVLAAAGAVVAIAGLFLVDAARGVPVRLIAVVTGWTAFTGGALVHGSSAALGGSELLPIEFWPVLALVAGAAIAIAWVGAGGRPTRLAEAGLAASLVAASVPTLLAIVDGDAPVLRSALVFPVLGMAHLASVASIRRPMAGPALEWSSLAMLVVGGLAAVGYARVDPFDVVTVPIAAALLGVGVVRMRRSRELGSWPALGAGLAVLLVPALVADVTDPELWRIVALGLVAAVVVLVGAMRRLQAPLLIGAAVLLVHALWQLWPWITQVYEAVWWWLWLGIAGVVLIVLAATYERQLRLARGVVRSIAGLR